VEADSRFQKRPLILSMLARRSGKSGKARLRHRQCRDAFQRPKVLLEVSEDLQGAMKGLAASGAKDLLNSCMAYVCVSRARYDAQIYTNHAATLGQEFSRELSHSRRFSKSQWRTK
jgi:hypothetical protein